MSADEITQAKLDRAAADLAPEDQTLEQARHTGTLRGDPTYLARWIEHHAQQAPVIDFRDLRPKGRGEGDRRVEPRRAGERELHYAEQILLSQACRYVDLLLDPAVDDGDETLLNSVADLARAVVTFRTAADKVNRRG